MRPIADVAAELGLTPDLIEPYGHAIAKIRLDALERFPTRRGKHLRFEWTGFELHLDDELWPVEGDRPEKNSGTVDLRIDGSVEFLAPDAPRQD